MFLSYLEFHIRPERGVLRVDLAVDPINFNIAIDIDILKQWPRGLLDTPQLAPQL